MATVLPKLSRNPEQIILNNKHSLSLMQDRITLQDNVTGMQVSRVQGGSILFSVSGADVPIINDRILLYQRVTSDGTDTKGLHYCFYTTSTVVGGVVTAKPLREVINPRATYDVKSNNIVLWFWTNFLVDPGTSYLDDSTYLYRINETDFDASVTVIEALCCATGSMQELYIVGGAVGLAGTGEGRGTDGYDLVPVFNMPKIISKRRANTGTYPYTVGPPILDFAASGGTSKLAVNGVLGDNYGTSITIPDGEVITQVEYATVSGVAALDFTTGCLLIDEA